MYLFGFSERIIIVFFEIGHLKNTFPQIFLRSDIPIFFSPNLFEIGQGFMRFQRVANPNIGVS